MLPRFGRRNEGSRSTGVIKTGEKDVSAALLGTRGLAVHHPAAAEPWNRSELSWVSVRFCLLQDGCKSGAGRASEPSC